MWTYQKYTENNLKVFPVIKAGTMWAKIVAVLDNNPKNKTNIYEFILIETNKQTKTITPA